MLVRNEKIDYSNQDRTSVQFNGNNALSQTDGGLTVLLHMCAFFGGNIISNETRGLIKLTF